MVSVILPNYNHAKYLRQRIESILNQTYQDLELIILDDCSIDNSKEIIEEYRSHPKVSKIFYNEKNSGQIAKQWQLGLQYAAGDYIWIAESDDYADREFLAEQIKMIQSKEHCGLVFCNSNIVNEKDEIIGSMEKWKNKFFKIDKWDNNYSNSGKDELFNYLIHACTINNLSSCIFRKSALSKVIRKVSNSKYTLDELLYMFLLYHNDISYNKNKLNFYREHASNASKYNSIYGRDFIDRFLNRLTFYRSENFSDKEKQIIFKKLVTEYRGILASIRLKNFKLNDFIMLHKNIKNPVLIFRLMFSAVHDRISNPYFVNNNT